MGETTSRVALDPISYPENFGKAVFGFAMTGTQHELTTITSGDRG
jgi:hypothetical protein